MRQNQADRPISLKTAAFIQLRRAYQHHLKTQRHPPNGSGASFPRLDSWGVRSRYLRQWQDDTETGLFCH